MVKVAQKKQGLKSLKRGNVKKGPVLNRQQWLRVAGAAPLKNPKKAVAEAWPAKDLNAYDFPDDMGWGYLCKNIAKKRGWSFGVPCHSKDRKNEATDCEFTVMFVREFEAMLRRQDPKVAFGRKGAVQDGYKLKRLPLPKRALWLQACSDYSLPGPNYRVTTREDCSKVFSKYRKTLPGKPGDYRQCGFPGIYNALAKTDFSAYFRDAPWYPRAYLLPTERDVALKRFDKSPNEYWITKPRNDCSGVGICVMKADSPTLHHLVKTEKQAGIVQRYIADPVLLGGYKFHMRIHMVITSLDPPQAYVQAGGQCLFSTKPYTLDPKTLGYYFDAPVHLTNTGLNMDDNQKDCFMAKKPVIGAGQQLSIPQLEKYLERTYPRFKKEDMWKQIMQISKEVVQYLAQSPGITRHGKFGPTEIFDIFGMDLMIDKNLKVWMCETNNSPCIEDQDKRVWGKKNPDYEKEHKCFEQLWHDIFTLLGLDASRRQTKGTLRNWYEVNFE